MRTPAFGVAQACSGATCLAGHRTVASREHQRPSVQDTGSPEDVLQVCLGPKIKFGSDRMNQLNADLSNLDEIATYMAGAALFKKSSAEDEQATALSHKLQKCLA